MKKLPSLLLCLALCLTLLPASLAAGDETYLISITTADGVVTSGYRAQWRWVALSRTDPGRPGILLRGEDPDVTGSLTRSDGLAPGEALDAWGKSQDGKNATLTLGQESWECITQYKDYGWQSVLYVEFLPRKDGGGYIKPDYDTLRLFRYAWAQNETVERKTYDEAVAELQSTDGYTTEQVFDSDYGTVFLYNYGPNPAGMHGFLTLVTKTPCSTGEGVVIGLPQPRNSLFCSTKPPHAAELSGDGKSFTYSYLYDHPVLSHEGEFLRPAGDFSYSVDLTTGKVTDSYTPLGYEKTLATLTQAEGYVVDQLLESSAATAVLRHQEFLADNGDPAYRDYQLYLVFKDDNAPEAFRQLLLPSTLYLTHRAYAPTDRAPDALALCADGKTLTYNYFFDAPLSNGDTVYHEAGTYTYIVDTATGELEVAHTDQVPSPAQPAVSVFSDVPAGSWFEEGVTTCAGKGVMVGTGGNAFSPERELSQAECLTLAFRLYGLMRGNEHVIEKAPADWGKLTLTLADGTVLEGYGYQSEVDNAFSWWSGRNGSEGVCAQVPGWTYEDLEAGAKAQREWMDAHKDICAADTPAALTLNGVTYQGTANCWMPVGPYVFQFQPETEKPGEVNAILHHAVFREVGPDRWWRDTAYTITQRGLEDIFDPVEFSDAPASRSFFAQLIADACEGHLEKINTIGDIPDLPREFPGPVTYPQAELYRDAVYALYEAGILTGVDQSGTFAADNTLTRAEAAVMVARALDEGQRISRDRSYHGIVGSLETEAGYEQETYFYSDASFRLPDNVTLILRYKPCAGDQSKRDYELWLVRREGDPQALRLSLPSTEVLPDGSAPTTQVPDSIRTVPDPSDPKHKVTLTYTYRFPEPLWNGNTMLHDKGTYTYTVEIPTGEQSVKLEDAYEHALVEATMVGGTWQLDERLETPLCTILVQHSEGGDGLYPGAHVTLIFKDGSPNGVGEVVELPTKQDHSYGSILPHSISLNEEKTILTYVYQFDADQYARSVTGNRYLTYKAGTYTTTVDLLAGTVDEVVTPKE